VERSAINPMDLSTLKGNDNWCLLTVDDEWSRGEAREQTPIWQIVYCSFLFDVNSVLKFIINKWKVTSHNFIQCSRHKLFILIRSVHISFLYQEIGISLSLSLSLCLRHLWWQRFSKYQ
jgi:hypothetical protein